MEPPDRKEPEAQTLRIDAAPLLPLGVLFLMLTLLGGGMLVYALLGRGGLLLGILGGLQALVCSAMLGALVRRWREASNATGRGPQSPP